ncbi:hypothetical protein DPMN_060961 [Dreissena polymorpha]|uniref:Uncharacterized protein n=1 Tax=Dreissena polymorpha TaxID=45954 RepID=A0A9D4C6Q0_DREPO|nr:hypothetical protein DPMN_060961 [Dreissena polymorpha]
MCSCSAKRVEDPSVWDTKPEDLVIHREQGYAAIEKHMKESHINLCSVQSKEVLGDIETLLNLWLVLQRHYNSLVGIWAQICVLSRAKGCWEISRRSCIYG